jgi:large subunit ribosomal protein L21
VTRILTSSPQPLVPITPRALTSLRTYPSRCHFATPSSCNEGGEEDHYEDEGSEDEWGDEEEAVAAKKPSGKTEEEKVAEAAEVGYKVVAPLGSDEKPFKPYEPVFAIVQACYIWFSLWVWSFRVGSHV